MNVIVCMRASLHVCANAPSKDADDIDITLFDANNVSTDIGWSWIRR